MADSRRTRDYQPDAPLDLQYLNDPSYTPLDRIGGQGMGGAGNESSAIPAGGMDFGLENAQSLGDQRTAQENQLFDMLKNSRSSYRMMTPGEAWQGLKDVGSSGMDLLGRGLNAITPSQDTVNNIAMRLQNAHAIGTGQTPLYMLQQQHALNMAQADDLMSMKRQQLAQQLQQAQLQKQQKDEDQALRVWQDHQMPLSMKKKISQQMATQGNVLAGNLMRLGDDQIASELDGLRGFIPPDKLNQAIQMMKTPNADLSQVEQVIQLGRERKQAFGAAKAQSERFQELQSLRDQGQLPEDHPLYQEYAKSADELIKRKQEAAERDLNLQRLGIGNQKAQIDLAAQKVMPQYTPEVDLPNGQVQRERFDPQTGQLSTIKGNKPPASVTNVNMKQESAFESELGKKQAEKLDKTQTNAMDARQIINTIHRGKALLDKGVITGVGADIRTTLGQALQQMGFMKGNDAISNTQAFVSLMAQNVAKHIKDFGAGTGLSNADREYAEALAGGKINLDEKSLRKILDMNELAARETIQAHNKSVKGIRSITPLSVEEPPAYVSPSKNTIPSLPQGSKQIGTSNGKPVYEDAAGKRWIGQ